MPSKPRNNLDQLAKEAIELEIQRRSLLHAEAALFSLMDAFGTEEAIRIWREMAQHLEDFG